MSAVLTFDAASHTYRADGVVRPSVTQVLQKLHDFSMVPEAVLIAAQERGTAVHKLCEFHDQSDLDPASIGDYWPYLDAWINFCADHKAEWTHIEHMGYSERYGYAGQWDRYGRLKGVPAIVDIKTAKEPHRVWGMQTAAYRQLAVEQHLPGCLVARRFTAQLRDDGTYKLLPWDDPDDWPAFLSLINLINWSTK
jgi:hypothetical protein